MQVAAIFVAMRFSGNKILTLALAALGMGSFTACAQHSRSGAGHGAAGTAAVTGRQHWVDSVYNKLNPDERLGQLFMLAAYSGGASFNQNKIEAALAKHQIGGLIFMQGGPERQGALTNRYQRLAQVPLLLAMDAEWGLGMRLDSVVNLPKQMMIGATHDPKFANELGKTIAAQCRLMGVNIDFAPVVDVNNNPNNPIINARSFGEDKRLVATMGIAYMMGLQDNGVMACAKHFPGHGDVSVDSHKDLPVITKTLPQLDTLELYPFKKMIAAGVKSIMVAHLSVPVLEKEPHVPTTLSYNAVTGLLKKQLGFEGLIFTDALNMQGVAKYFQPGEADVRALEAGNDVLLFSQDVPTAIIKIKAALAGGKLDKADIEHRVKKILAAKYDAGLAHWKPVAAGSLVQRLNEQTADLSQEIADAAVTQVRNNGLLQQMRTRHGKIAYVSVNGAAMPETKNALERHGTITTYTVGATGIFDVTQLKRYDVVLIEVHKLSLYPANNYGLALTQLRFLEEAAGLRNAAVVLMGNAYAAKYVCASQNLIITYEDNQWTQHTVAQVLSGALNPTGKLPVTPPCLK